MDQNKFYENCKRVHPGDYRWKTGVCFRCGKLGHKISECPTLAPPSLEKNEQPNAMVFALTKEETGNISDVVIGMILVNSLIAKVLFDYGASHSFVCEVLLRL